MAFSLTVAPRKLDATFDIIDNPVKRSGKAHDWNKVSADLVVDLSIKRFSLTAGQEPFESDDEAPFRREGRRIGFQCAGLLCLIR